MLDKEVELLRRQKPRILDEIAAIKGQVEAEQRQLKLIQQRLQDYSALQGKGLGISSTGIELEREQARNQGNLSRYAAEIARLELGVGEIDIKIQDAHNQLTRRVMSELQETRAKLQEIDVALPSARDIRELKLQQSGGVDGPNAERPPFSIVIVRSRGREAQLLKAIETTLLEPGDVVEVRRVPGAATGDSRRPRRDRNQFCRRGRKCGFIEH